MYDQQTESFWQQFTGEAIIGSMVGKILATVPARIESWALFREEFPDGRVLVPPTGTGRAYGRNPYQGYDTAPSPFLYRGRMPSGIDAWSLDYIRKNTPVRTSDGLMIIWREGQNSALDDRVISRGRDIGNVRVTRGTDDVAFSVDFAFAYRAFYPEGDLVK